MTRAPSYAAVICAFATLLVMTLGERGVAAADDNIVYEIKAYGGDRTVVVLSGGAERRLATQLSHDGRSLRISGAGVTFLQRSAAPVQGNLSYEQQVRRGAYTDLVLGFLEPVEINATPGAADLKIFVKRRDSPPAGPRNVLEQAPLQASYSGGKTEKGAGNSQITINFPVDAAAGSRSLIARDLRRAAYWIDFTWSWITGIRARDGRIPGFAAAAPQTERRSVEELERLVDDLTGELIELRKACPGSRSP